jgi:predicted membrane protein
MKTRKVFWGLLFTAIAMIIIFVLLEVYYAAIAIAIGMLIVGHREWWSLITRRKLPPADERVKENVNKSIRNSFIFFGVVALLTMLFYITDGYGAIQPDMEYFLGGLLLSVGIVYVLSYIFYDRVEANLNARGLKVIKVFSLIAGISLIVFILNAFFVNTIYPSMDFFTFHRILLYVSPVVFAVGFIGGAVVFIKGLLTTSS